jgi:hypothetical protein
LNLLGHLRDGWIEKSENAMKKLWPEEIGGGKACQEVPAGRHYGTVHFLDSVWK